MARHARRGVVSGVVRHRAVVAFAAMAAVAMLATAWVHRDDRDAGLLWLGFGILTASVTVIGASLSIGPRPLRSLGVGAWLLVAALGALLVWTGRDAIDPTRPRDLLVAPIMLLLAIGLAPVALWMMVRRPEQAWEKELCQAPRHPWPDEGEH